jgi:hypothetical protein
LDPSLAKDENVIGSLSFDADSCTRLVILLTGDGSDLLQFLVRQTGKELTRAQLDR